jgi:hypothetical protein
MLKKNKYYQKSVYRSNHLNFTFLYKIGTVPYICGVIRIKVV